MTFKFELNQKAQVGKLTGTIIGRAEMLDFNKYLIKYDTDNEGRSEAWHPENTVTEYVEPELGPAESTED